MLTELLFSSDAEHPVFPLLSTPYNIEITFHRLYCSYAPTARLTIFGAMQGTTSRWSTNPYFALVIAVIACGGIPKGINTPHYWTSLSDNDRR